MMSDGIALPGRRAVTDRTNSGSRPRAAPEGSQGNSMHLKTFAFVTILCAGVTLPEMARAFDHGCGRGGRAVACYDKVRLPDVYATETRPVLLRPAFSQVLRTRPVVGVRSERIELAPARWDRLRRPAIYGEQVERVLVAPARRRYVAQPAVTRTVRESVVVKAARVHWERRRGFLGHGERLCRIVVPAETREVERQIVVAPARRVAEFTPAVYETRVRSVLLRPESSARVYRPAVHSWIHRQVVLRPARDYVVDHPAVIGVRHHQVFVRHGGYGWRRSDRW